MPKARTGMRFVEIITIYLSIGASVGVATFLRVTARTDSRPRAILIALLATLFFPVALVVIFAPADLKRQRAQNQSHESAETEGANLPPREMDVERAKRAALNELRRLQDCLIKQADPPQSARIEEFFSSLAGKIERYAELSIVLMANNSDDAPQQRATELCRLAGRTGEDLELAGRCIARRSAARLQARVENARDELFYSVLKARARLQTLFAATPDELQLECDFSSLLLQLYERMIYLTILLRDSQTASRFANLRDGERAQNAISKDANLEEDSLVNSNALKVSRAPLT